jgi:hypothetical protein
MEGATGRSNKGTESRSTRLLTLSEKFGFQIAFGNQTIFTHYRRLDE